MSPRVLLLGTCVLLACGKGPAPAAGAGEAAKATKTESEAESKQAAEGDAKAPTKQAAEDDSKTAAEAGSGGEAAPEPKASPHPRLSVAPTPDLAVVSRDEGVVVLDDTGAKVGTLLPGGGGWCRVDPRAEVLWATSEQGLVTVDLRSDAAPVVVHPEPFDTIVISYPDEDLGRPGEHEFQDGVAVRMVEPPKVEAILGCDGDMAWYCFEDAEDFEKAAAERLEANAAALAKHPTPAAALAPIVARSKGRRATLPEPGRAPEPKKVKIPTEGCDEWPEDCGEASVLPGTRYWRIVVGNSRGDFYHEDHQLYDPKTSEFFDPARPGTRSKTPLPDMDVLEPVWISPSGTLAMGYDSVVSFERGVIVKDLDGVCGFWGGGFEP